MSEDWEEDGDPWRVVKASRPFENAWFVLDKYDVINPAGAAGEYTVLRPHRHAVGVLPLEDDGRVHLVGQWRFPLKRYSWEMPEGGAEPGESPEVCAQRELAEEAGVSAERLEKILEMDLSNSLTDETATIFLATGLSPKQATPDETEILRRRVAPFGEVLGRVKAGQIRDSLTVAAVLRLHHMAVTGELALDLAQAVLK